MSSNEIPRDEPAYFLQVRYGNAYVTQALFGKAERDEWLAKRANAEAVSAGHVRFVLA